MSKTGPSRKPQDVAEGVWYYENARSIDVVVYVSGADGISHCRIVRLMASKLEESLARMSPRTTRKARK